MISAILALSSCVHDEVYSSADTVSMEYINKTLWKQDEKYIKNIMTVYLENEKDIRKSNGVPFWDYATTVNTFDESFLMVPVVENKRVVSVLQVPRKGSKVYFYYSRISKQINFFQGLIFAKHKKIVFSESDYANKAIICTTQIMAVWLPNDESDPDPESGNGVWSQRSIIVCKEYLESCVSIINEFGECDGGGGDDNEDPGYDYPGEVEEPIQLPNPKDPCAKLKAQTKGTTFKSNITSLEGKTGDSYESGFRISNTSQNQILQNKPGTQQVNMTVFSNTVTLMHSHFDGLYPMFSPGDIIFFNQWIVWAQNWNAVPTNLPKIPLNNLTFTLVTSNGNYSFNFDGTSTTPLPNYTMQELEQLDKDYIKNLSKAATIGNVSGNVSYDMPKLEKEFLKFMSDKMNMSGLKLFRTTDSGNTELSLNTNGTLKEKNCP